jgi:flagellar biosynthesis protein FliQ
MDTTLRLALMIIIVGALVSLFQIGIWRISKENRFFKYVPSIVLFLVAGACIVKGIWFSTGMEDLAYFVTAILLGGAFVISLVTGLLIDVLAKNSRKRG